MKSGFFCASLTTQIVRFNRIIIISNQAKVGEKPKGEGK